jgi:hypothetical protein
VLEEELPKGPVADGRSDQTWTLTRIKTLIGRPFHKNMTLSAIAQMRHRHGFSHQVPASRAVERDEEAVTGWGTETWPQAEKSVAALRAWLCFEDEAGLSMTPTTRYAPFGTASV